MYGSKPRSTDGLYENRKDSSGYSSSKREWNSQVHGSNDDSSKNNKRIRTRSSSKSRMVSSSDSQQQRQNGDKEKQSTKDTKMPLRVFGDWSEFRSSTGKTYFYNCKTEISQWEKPKGWSTDDTTTTTTTTTSSSTSIERKSTSRCKMDESTLKKDTSNIKHNQNGHTHSHISTKNSNQDSSQICETLNSTDDNSRISFASTNSKESTNAIVQDRNDCASSDSSNTNQISDIKTKSVEKDSSPLNGNETKHSTNKSTSLPVKIEQNTEIESTTASISKAEREQEIQKYYRSDLIRHLTDWPSNQFEKQCLKLFDDYYGYSAKMSTAFIELKGLKSNFRVLDIKRSFLTKKLLWCQQNLKEREDENLS